MERYYSPRLGTLRDAQLQAALDHFELGRLVAAEPATDGLFGQIVFLRTTGGEYAFRGYPHAGQLRNEHYFIDHLQRSCDVPVPWPSSTSSWHAS